MYRKTQSLVPLNVLFDDGGVGDAIARLPPNKWIVETHPHVQVNLWAPEYFVDFAKKCYQHPRFKVWSYNDKDKYNEQNYARVYSKHYYNNLSVQMTKHAFHVTCNIEPEDPNWFNYLKPNLNGVSLFKYGKLPDKYVVISAGFTSGVREFKPEYINEIVKYIKSKGYEVLFLGKRIALSGNGLMVYGNFRSEVDYTQGIDLREKTTLLEACKIISKSKGIVGLDSGLLHLAACTDVPIVGGFTTLKPEHRMPYRNGKLGWNYYPVVPPESLACRHCQSNWNFTFEHQFHGCYYVNNKEDDKIRCIEELTPNLYIEQLEKIL